VAPLVGKWHQKELLWGDGDSSDSEAGAASSSSGYSSEEGEIRLRPPPGAFGTLRRPWRFPQYASLGFYGAFVWARGALNRQNKRRCSGLGVHDSDISSTWLVG
jgi:hypothetical protein